MDSWLIGTETKGGGNDDSGEKKWEGRAEHRMQRRGNRQGKEEGKGKGGVELQSPPTSIPTATTACRHSTPLRCPLATSFVML